MAIFYAASNKEMLQLRKKIFLDYGLPALQQNGFQKSPFSGTDFGYHGGIGHLYQLCRLAPGELEMISANIIQGDRWIKFHLNIFKLQPTPNTLAELTDADGLKFVLPPNSASQMRLKSDDIAGPPILSYDNLFRNHNIRSYYTKAGLAKRADQLGKTIQKDLTNIDYYIKRWHELHPLVTTTWDGTPV